MKYKELIYLEESAMMWDVVLREEDVRLTLFQGLEKPAARRLKERIDNEIGRRIELAVSELMSQFKVTAK